MHEPDTRGHEAEEDRVLADRERLPLAWRRLDRAVVRATETSLFLVGSAFTVMVTLEVVSRYVFDFSIFFINAAARFLLVWFFMLGAGLALRQGAHVGFELVVRALGPALRRVVFLVAQSLVLVFFVLMLWSSYHTLGPSMRQTEAALGVSLLWVMLAFPVGFGLLTYHLVTMVTAELRRAPARTTAP